MKQKSLIRIAAALIACAASLGLGKTDAGPAFAQQSENAAPEISLTELGRIEAYLNSTRTLSGDFTQVGPDGAVTEGRVWLDRPGRLRFEYTPPTPILVVADGSTLYFLDRELGQVDRIPIGFTPLGVLTDDQVDLEDGVKIRKLERKGGLVHLVVADADRPYEGELTLIFDQAPINLRQWLVQDSQGLITSVTLRNMVANKPLNPLLFVFQEP